MLHISMKNQQNFWLDYYYISWMLIQSKSSTFAPESCSVIIFFFFFQMSDSLCFVVKAFVRGWMWEVQGHDPCAFLCTWFPPAMYSVMHSAWPVLSIVLPATVSPDRFPPGLQSGVSISSKVLQELFVRG